MKTKRIWMTLVATLAAPAAATAADSSVFKSTAEDQTAVEVTVYNSNMALIKDIRKVRYRVRVGL